ncbi:hypothetical protein ACFPK9_04910 [Rubritalea spongiae]|uniref:Uncharacterized protein n=1 Tax=Rubritalea spongiae TaxID=430797 RepID=A0ABW5E5L4_9BACT
MNYLLAIVCACITGIAIGIGIHHNFEDPNSHLAPAGVNPTQNTLTDSGSHSTQDNDDNNDLAISANFDATALSQVQEQLQQLSAQYEQMLIHQSELNREVNAIQFRLDTHSESFRPLRAERDTQTTSPSPAQGISPLLPPLR